MSCDQWALLRSIVRVDDIGLRGKCHAVPSGILSQKRTVWLRHPPYDVPKYQTSVLVRRSLVDAVKLSMPGY